MIEEKRAFPLLNKTTPIHITLAGITYPDPSYRIERSNAKVSVIEYILDGAGYVEIDGLPQQVKKDMIYFLPAGEKHCYYADKNNPFTKLFINIKASALSKQLFYAYGLTKKRFFYQKEIKEVFEKIPNAIQSSHSDIETQAELLGILLEITSRLYQAEHLAEHSEESLIMKNHIDTHLNRIVSNKELSDLIFRSSDYCLKTFQKEFVITPYAYQLEQKMQIAKTLLNDTNMPISAIAECLGYSDPHYFSNIFKEKCGISPLKFRNESR